MNVQLHFFSAPNVKNLGKYKLDRTLPNESAPTETSSFSTSSA